MRLVLRLLDRTFARRLSSPRAALPACPQFASSYRFFNTTHSYDMADAAPPCSAPQKRGKPQGGRPWKKKTKREKNITQGSSEDVLRMDLLALMKDRGIDPEAPVDLNSLPAPGSEIEVEVHELSSTGDGLAIQKDSSINQIYTVPFVVPGDVARIKVVRHLVQDKHSMADFLSVVTPSPRRDDSRIQCQYFSRCGGCQFQMLDYADQLNLKKRIVEKAFLNFSGINLPVPVGETIGSPLQYGYRTKLTPHFDGPPGGRALKRSGQKAQFANVPEIGFMLKGRRRVLDIEDCPIGTPVVRKGVINERKRVADNLGQYSRGATLLVRENTKRYPKGDAEIPTEINDGDTVMVEEGEFVDVKTYETNALAMTTEYVNGKLFTNPAGSFFQNNNSILKPFTEYVRANVHPPSTTPETSPIKYLIDAYSGSGLFTISLSDLFINSVGIDIAEQSITYARDNARLNGMSEERCSFIAADAGELFKSVTYAPDETLVILDPPRKGCDEDFLRQLLRFAPKRVIYISCNVHTQARDVGFLVRGSEHSGGCAYEVESLRGFDFFPQTGHVEGACVMSRVDKKTVESTV
ncbi:tRNA (uracil(54)-C(5))-methyltransferase [Ceratocystis fimbriata CBS 114723]|uniref:tRNA (Uracil(54)-C(5))-methyltransferase n=2 Tax=Ceratocystis TaxID=5157 RepID=A0A2C5X2P4_9PEZI|nr:tRNA (uracil(54)-C(5))-methyltransferase [Ceratocystis fimbriata CBS 114723]